MSFLSKKDIDRVNHFADRQKKRESSVEKTLVKGVKDLGGLCLKCRALNFAGFPDRTCLLPGEIIVFVELKAPGKKAGGRQKTVHGILRNLGFRVEVLDTNEKVKDFLEEMECNNII